MRSFLIAVLFIFTPSPEPGVTHLCRAQTRAMVMDTCPNSPDPNAQCPRMSDWVPIQCDILGDAPPTLPGTDGRDHLTLDGEWYGQCGDPMPEGVVAIEVCARDAAGNEACAPGAVDWSRFKWPYP